MYIQTILFQQHDFNLVRVSIQIIRFTFHNMCCTGHRCNLRRWTGDESSPEFCVCKRGVSWHPPTYTQYYLTKEQNCFHLQNETVALSILRGATQRHIYWIRTVVWFEIPFYEKRFTFLTLEFCTFHLSYFMILFFYFQSIFIKKTLNWM